MTESMIAVVEEKLCDNWSLEKVSDWLLEERGEHLSHERIYRHIWADKASGGELHIHLWRRGKKYQKRCVGKRSWGRSATLQALRSARTL